MMAEAEYISKEAALACFSDWIDRYGHEHTADEMVEYQKIEDLPAANVRTAVEGKLVNPYMEEYYGEWYHCSVCGAGGLGLGDNFCPNCGADMREVTP